MITNKVTDEFDNVADSTKCYICAINNNNDVIVQKVTEISQFSETLSFLDNNTSVTYKIRADTCLDGNIFEEFSKFLTECEQIKSYEDKISKLQCELESMTEDRDKHKSLYLSSKSLIYDLQNKLDIEIFKNRKSNYIAFFRDFNSDERGRVVKVPINEDFFQTAYWNELFTKSELDFVGYTSPKCVTHERVGINHWFVICKSVWSQLALNSLQYDMNDELHVIDGCMEHLYHRLEEIYKIVFGKNSK